MSYIGRQPTAAALTASDVTDGIITTAKIADAGITNAKLNADIISGDTALGATPADTDEFLVSDAGTLKRMDYSYIKAANTPVFNAYLSSTQTVTDAVATKIEIDTENFDTGSTYDNSTNYRFTPGYTGKTFIYGACQNNSANDSGLDDNYLAIYKNGANYAFTRTQHPADSRVQGHYIGLIISHDDNDYFELYTTIEITAGTPSVIGSGFLQTYFGAFKIIE